MKTFLPIVFTLALMGCANDAIESHKTDNKDIHVDLLFTHDGCRVYRFSDAGEFHYYTVCGGFQTSTMTDKCLWTNGYEHCEPFHDAIQVEVSQ